MEGKEPMEGPPTGGQEIPTYEELVEQRFAESVINALAAWREAGKPRKR